MSGIHDAKLNDVYRDDRGHLWIVSGTCDERSVRMNRLYETGADLSETKEVAFGGVSGQRWRGFVRLVEEK